METFSIVLAMVLSGVVAFTTMDYTLVRFKVRSDVSLGVSVLFAVLVVVFGPRF